MRTFTRFLGLFIMGLAIYFLIAGTQPTIEDKIDNTIATLEKSIVAAENIRVLAEEAALTSPEIAKEYSENATAIKIRSEKVIVILKKAKIHLIRGEEIPCELMDEFEQLCEEQEEQWNE